MKKNVLLVVLALLCVTNIAMAEEKKLGISLDLTYTSKWLSKGVEAYGPRGGLFETIDIDLYGSGFGVKVTHRNALGTGYVNKERFDYRPYYKGRMFEGEKYVTNYNISVGYEHYTKVSRQNANTTWEWIFGFSWPELLGNGIVPSYTVHYEYPASAATRDGVNTMGVTGWVHRFGLGYDMAVEQLPNPLHLSTEVAYNDGLGGKPHDWAYVNFGVSTKFKMSENMALVPSVYHQITMDDSISPNKDITYAMMSLKYKF